MTKFSFSFVNGEKRHTTISKSILFVLLYIKAKHSLKYFLDDDEEGEEGEEGEEKMPSCGDYIMHFLTLPWKLLFALIPPTGEYLYNINIRIGEYYLKGVRETGNYCHLIISPSFLHRY